MFTNTKAENRQTNQLGVPSSQEEQILYLKRLLVTLKRQYETDLQNLNDQLQVEISHKQSLQEDLAQSHLELENTYRIHDEEQVALRQQQNALKDLLKKTQNECKHYREQFESSTADLKEKEEKASLETEQLKKELESAYKKINCLEFEEKKHSSILVKSISKEEEELKALESRYMELLNEKRVTENCINQQLQDQSYQLSTLKQQKALFEEKYESLKQELIKSTEHLEEAWQGRLQAEDELKRLQAMIQTQEAFLIESKEQVEAVMQERENMQQNIQRLTLLLEESETQLKIAQQHLAKKVKEVTLLAEKIETRQAESTEYQQKIETTKIQINHLQSTVEFYQKQEAKLQEQLSETLKSVENQSSKWEEKYFKIYDKWQESETRVRELKILEEKHLQMQKLLTNLGSFMGNSFMTPQHSLFHQVNQEPITDHHSSLNLLNSSESVKEVKTDSIIEQKFDLFGMRQSVDTLKSL